MTSKQHQEIIVPNIFRQQKQQESPLRNCNRIMVTAEGDTIYLPTYVRIDIKHFKSLNYEELYGQFFASVDIIVFVEGLPQIIVDNLAENLMFNTAFHGNISMNPKKNKKMQIQVEDIKMPQSKVVSFKRFRVQSNFKSTIKPQLQYTPIQLLDLVLTVSPKTIQLKLAFDGAQKKGKKCEIKFILMDNNCEQQSIQTKINFNATAVFGNYDLAQKKLMVEYSPTADEKTLKYFGKDIFSIFCKKPEAKDEQLKQGKFQGHAHFHIPLYKFPCVPFTTILVPLVILGIFNLAIFFQSRDLGDRINNLSALMIAFIGIIPVIRESIPPSPNITRIQQLVYLEIVTTLFCLFESWYYYDPDNIDVDRVQVIYSVFFIFSFVCTMFVTIVPLIFIVIHYLFLRNTYNQKVNQKCQNASDYYYVWKHNTDADRFFLPKLKDYKQPPIVQETKSSYTLKSQQTLKSQYTLNSSNKLGKKKDKKKQKIFFAQIKEKEWTQNLNLNTQQHQKLMKYKQKYNQIIGNIEKGLNNSKAQVKISRKKITSILELPLI